MEQTKKTKEHRAKQQPTASDMEKWFMANYDIIKKYAEAKEQLRIINPSTSENRQYQTFSKELLRNYMRNPASNYTYLRSLSRFLYNRSQPYRRIIHYNATMIDPSARAVIPRYDLSSDVSKDEVLKQYYDTLNILDNLNLKQELFKLYVISWREDTAYGCVYYDDTGFFILPLDGEYCKITSIYSNGSFGFDMDMTYFRNRQEQLELWGEPFTTMYDEYSKNTTTGRWQPMPDENCICFKINTDDTTLPLPPYLAMFNSIISLADIEEIQAVKDQIDIYKLIVARLETLSNTNEPDNFSVDLGTAIEYFNKMTESLPDYIGATISPLKIDTIEFNKDQTSDINTIEKSTEALYNTSGGAQVLNSSTISGSTAWNGAILADSEYALSSLLPQTEQWLNRFLSYHLTNPAKVKFLEVTNLTKDSYKKTVKEDGTYGLPVKLLLNTLNGFSEMDTLSMNFLEEECLGLSEKFKPFQSSNTMSSSDASAEKDITDLTDEGEATRDADKNDM